MPSFTGRRPARGSVDWAAERIRTMLDEDELTEIELRRLQQSGWTPPASSMADAQIKTGDPVADFVRPDLLRREAMRDEARRRARQQLAQATPIEGGTAEAPPTALVQPQAMIDPDDERAYRFIDEILQWEGGYEPTGPTNFGITQNTLDSWNRRYGRKDGMPVHVKDLTKDQARQILKADYYDAYRLREIADEDLAHELLDIYVNTGTKGHRHIIQSAVDQVMRDHDLYNRHEQPFALTDEVGPRSRSRLNWLVASGYSRELRNALTDRRYAYVRDEGKLRDMPGLNQRIWRFWEWASPFGQ
jgi:hypothetical protein